MANKTYLSPNKNLRVTLDNGVGNTTETVVSTAVPTFIQFVDGQYTAAPGDIQTFLDGIASSIGLTVSSL